MATSRGVHAYPIPFRVPAPRVLGISETVKSEIINKQLSLSDLAIVFDIPLHAPVELSGTFHVINNAFSGQLSIRKCFLR